MERRFRGGTSSRPSCGCDADPFALLLWGGMRSLLVTVGTDGSKDWVKTPDGQKFALGPVSVLTFVTRLGRNTRVAQKALDEFLEHGEAMLAVDDDRLWALLAPRRARWAAGPFMGSDHGGYMGTTAAESREVKTLNRLALEASRLCDELHAALSGLGSRIKSFPPVDGPTARDIEKFLSVLSEFRGDALGWGGMAFSDPEGLPKQGRSKERLAFDTYEANMRVAHAILAKARESVSTIDTLAAKGKRFNVARARADIARVTAKVANICSDSEMTESWVARDLAKLAARNDRIHALFHPQTSSRVTRSG